MPSQANEDSKGSKLWFSRLCMRETKFPREMMIYYFTHSWITMQINGMKSRTDCDVNVNRKRKSAEVIRRKSEKFFSHMKTSSLMIFFLNFQNIFDTQKGLRKSNKCRAKLLIHWSFTWVFIMFCTFLKGISFKSCFLYHFSLFSTFV